MWLVSEEDDDDHHKKQKHTQHQGRLAVVRGEGGEGGGIH